MKKLTWFLAPLALAVLAALPCQAGVSIHVGGGFVGSGFRGSGYCGGYHSFYGRGYGYYGGYGYAPYYGYASYPIGFDSGYYGGSVYPSAYTPAPETTQPTTQAANPAAAPTGPLSAGTVDTAGFVHSPYSTSAFKPATVSNGQVFYDPTTGQPFLVHMTAPTPAPAPVAPATTSLPMGKLDEFGYVHSPFSTFTFKVQNGNYAQTFRDPFTSQSFTVSAPAAATAVASAKATP